MPGGGYVKRPAVRIRGKKNPGADAARLNCSFFVYFVVQILFVIELRAKPVPGYPWLKILNRIRCRCGRRAEDENGSRKFENTKKRKANSIELDRTRSNCVELEHPEKQEK